MKNGPMEIGKIPNSILKELVFDKLQLKRPEVLVRPQVGMDCCALEFGNYACVMSTDPITGSSKNAGKLAVHISCNDVASFGVEPIGLLITILVPPGTTGNDLDETIAQLYETARSINVEIIGGHTEVTDAVTRFVAVSTAVGRIVKEKMVKTSGSNPGDALVLTKYAGLEGTAILASEKEEAQTVLGKELSEEAKSFFESLSIIKEALISADYGATSMHDVTEGGLLGAVWELCEASGNGAVVYEEKVPIAASTRLICSHFKIDPLKLISSGCLLITCKDGDGLAKLLNSCGIPASVIGTMEKRGKRILKAKNGDVPIDEPGPDELYKVIGNI